MRQRADTQWSWCMYRYTAFFLPLDPSSLECKCLPSTWSFMTIALSALYIYIGRLSVSPQTPSCAILVFICSANADSTLDGTPSWLTHWAIHSRATGYPLQVSAYAVHPFLSWRLVKLSWEPPVLWNVTYLPGAVVQMHGCQSHKSGGPLGSGVCGNTYYFNVYR